uniref:Uncharacterized protein n=1 Tax=Rhizophora mucronata TaxID=61149 RepID=A0A2P2NWF5_RHIMU
MRKKKKIKCNPLETNINTKALDKENEITSDQSDLQHLLAYLILNSFAFSQPITRNQS